MDFLASPATTSLIAFTAAAALLTITPGADTALVLRTAAVEGERAAMRAGAGIVTGVLGWGLLTALGIGGLLALSDLAYRALQLAGALYLAWLGLCLLGNALRPQTQQPGPTPEGASPRWFWRGLLTNLLNPKVGLFYVSLLPQFIPTGGSPLLYGLAFSLIHAALGLVWFLGLARLLRPVAGVIRRPAFRRGMDGVTGTLFLALGAGLALSRRP